MASHPISVTTYAQLGLEPTDEEVLAAYRFARVEAEAKLHEKLDNHPGDRGPLFVTLVVLLGQEVDCDLNRLAGPCYGFAVEGQ